jgi:hypothetical protein
MTNHGVTSRRASYAGGVCQRFRKGGYFAERSTVSMVVVDCSSRTSVQHPSCSATAWGGITTVALRSRRLTCPYAYGRRRARIHRVLQRHLPCAGAENRSSTVGNKGQPGCRSIFLSRRSFRRRSCHCRGGGPDNRRQHPCV